MVWLWLCCSEKFNYEFRDFIDHFWRMFSAFSKKSECKLFSRVSHHSWNPEEEVTSLMAGLPQDLGFSNCLLGMPWYTMYGPKTQVLKHIYIPNRTFISERTTLYWNCILWFAKRSCIFCTRRFCTITKEHFPESQVQPDVSFLPTSSHLTDSEAEYKL